MNVAFHRFDPETMEATEIARIEDGEIVAGEETIEGLDVDLSASESAVVDRYDGPRVFAEALSDESHRAIEHAKPVVSKVDETWVPYFGPLGGEGWVNVPTGYVKYVDEKPDSDAPIRPNQIDASYERMAADAAMAWDLSDAANVLDEYDVGGDDATGYEVAREMVRQVQEQYDHYAVGVELSKLQKVDSDSSKTVEPRETIDVPAEGPIRSDARIYLMDATETPPGATVKYDPMNNPYVEFGDVESDAVEKSDSVAEEVTEPSQIPALEVQEVYRVWVEAPEDVPGHQQARMNDDGDGCYYEIELGGSSVIDLSEKEIDPASVGFGVDSSGVSKEDLRTIGVSQPERFELSKAPVGRRGDSLVKAAESPIALLYGFRSLSPGDMRRKRITQELNARGVERIERVLKARETVADPGEASDVDLDVRKDETAIVRNLS